jgi:hypothetical protein
MYIPFSPFQRQERKELREVGKKKRRWSMVNGLLRRHSF